MYIISFYSIYYINIVLLDLLYVFGVYSIVK